jgi:hypothetical protein
VECRIKAAKDHNRNLNPCIKYSSLTALMTDIVGEATTPFRCNSRKQRPTDPTPPRKYPHHVHGGTLNAISSYECVKQPSGSSSIGAQARTLLITRRPKPKLEMG